ncbi:MAG TPA: hypothetical protein DCP08_10395, partial [Chloroflexi bacterium]|nr:hypothetical protein [Chloroflexota bacterium]
MGEELDDILQDMPSTSRQSQRPRTVNDLQKGVSAMAETSGSLPIDRAQIERLVKLYWLETYLFTDVHEKFEQGEGISEFDFYCIVYWKRNASKTNIQKGLAKLGKTPAELLDEVRRAEEIEAKFEVLTQVSGIGVAIASAILAVCYPEEYTVVDTYVLRMLKDWGCLSDHSLTDERYLEYNKLCKRWSRELGISLRQVDRVLWAKAWKERVVPPPL